MSSTVMTVTGPVPISDLGFTLPHEHIFANQVREYRGNGLLNDEALAILEIEKLIGSGGRTLIDCTIDEVARDPLALQRVSKATGLNIVMGCGHYRDPYLDNNWFDKNAPDAIAEIIVRDLMEGVDDTGVRSGIIGEIGADKWYISAAEERSFRAAARAHHKTGITITTHAARWPVGLPQLDLLAEENVDPRRVISGIATWFRRPGITRRLPSEVPGSSSTRSAGSRSTTLNFAWGSCSRWLSSALPPTS